MRRLLQLTALALLCIVLTAPTSYAQLNDIDSTQLKQRLRQTGVKIRLVNVWATWCSPCVKEFPYLLDLRRRYMTKGVEFLLISADLSRERQQVAQFLRSQKVNFTTYIKSGDDMAFIDSLSTKWNGALPATFIFDQQGGLLYFWHGEVELQEFDRKIDAAIKSLETRK